MVGIGMETKETLILKLGPLFEKYANDLIAAYIFGSVAEGKAHSRSDIDIAVLPESRDRQYFFDLRDVLYVDLCRVLKTDNVDLVLLKAAKNVMLIDRIIHKGCMIWEKDIERRKEFEAEKLHEILDFKEHRYRTLGV